jgi:hypothetical protein
MFKKKLDVRHIRSLFKRNLTLKDETFESLSIFKKAGHILKKLFSFKIIKLIILVTVLLIATPIVIFFLYRPTVQEHLTYGVTFSPKYSKWLGQDWKQAYTKILDDLEVRNIRIMAYWDEIEKEPGVYDFSEIEWQVQEAEKRNTKVLLSMGRKVPRFPECFEPNWWKDLKDPQVKRDAVDEYLTKTVQQLKGYKTITRWQVENEPFFPFGDCEKIEFDDVKREVALVRSLDKRPILVQDSGEGGFWFPSYSLGDYLGISMYRKIWYDFWGVFLGNHIPPCL